MSWGWDFPKYSVNWKEISDRVKARDHYICQQCGAHGYKANPPGKAVLNACHIISKRKTYNVHFLIFWRVQ